MSVSHGDVGVTLRSASELFNKLKANVEANKLQDAEAVLKQLKVKLVGLPSFLAPAATSSTRLQEFMLTREALEMAVLLQVRRKDLVSFDMHLDMLRPYYSKDDFVGLDAQPSERRLVIQGLNLLRLLVGNRLADFYANYEVMPRDEQKSLYIKFPVTLEGYLAEGSFNKLLQARAKAPSGEYLPLLEMLELTVRAEVAKCVPQAYTNISVEGAKQLLMLQSEKEVEETGDRYGWKKQHGNNKEFVFESAVARVETVVPFKRVLTEHLVHTKQIQDVV